MVWRCGWLAGLSPTPGLGVFHYGSGAIYEGQFTQGCFNGLGVFHAADGNRYEGEWCVDAAPVLHANECAQEDGQATWARHADIRGRR